MCYTALTFLKPLGGYDDALDCFGVHGMGGMWGAIASGLFAATLGSGIESNAQQVVVQLKGVVFTAIYAPLATLVILTLLKTVFGSLRVDDEAEEEGLDLSEHSEAAYVSVGGGFGGGTLVERPPQAGGAHPVGAPRPA